MAEDDTIEEGVLEQFEQRLTPCIERGDLDACVEEAAQLAGEAGISAGALLALSAQMGEKEKYELAYVLALGAVDGLDNSKKAIAYSNAGAAAKHLKNLDKAELHHLKAIEINPKNAVAHYNYANLLQELDKKDEAATHYLKAIELDPNNAAAHHNCAILLQELATKAEAATHYLKAIELDPNIAEAHGAYGLLLIDYDKRDDALFETEFASKLFKETGRITHSYLAKAWFYERYSKKYLSQKEYLKSSDDLLKASDEYFNAAETAEGDLIDNLILQGNVLKAKSFMRKIPPKPWYNKIYKLLGIKPDIPEFVWNLQNAAVWYQKASVCEVDGKKDVCDACHLSISVFSEVLDAMSAFISGNNAEITKDKWLNSLEGAGKTYADKELKTGIALVDSLKQLVKCVDKLAEQRAVGLIIQEERLGKCYDNLTKVNENLGGVLGIISDHATEAIRDYAKKEGMGFVAEENSKPSFFDNWLVKAAIGAIVTIILGIIANQLFEWRIQDIVFAGIFNM